MFKSVTCRCVVVMGLAVLFTQGCGEEPVPPRPAPSVDATGSWEVTWELGGSFYVDPATLAMDVDGIITGTFDHWLYGLMNVTGWVSGYDVHLVCSDGIETIVIDMVATGDGLTASGSWSSPPDSGTADAVKL